MEGAEIANDSANCPALFSPSFSRCSILRLVGSARALKTRSAPMMLSRYRLRRVLCPDSQPDGWIPQAFRYLANHLNDSTIGRCRQESVENITLSERGGKSCVRRKERARRFRPLPASQGT